MILPQPRDHDLLKFVRNTDDLFKFQIRNIPGGVVARRVSLLREHPHLLNQPGIRSNGEFQRFDCLQVMSQLRRSAITASAQCNICRRACRIERRFKATIRGDRVNLSVFEVAENNPKQARYLFSARRFDPGPTVLSPFL